MDIIQRAAKLFPLETTGEPYQTHTLEKIKVVRELVIEVERLREALIEIASMDVYHRDGKMVNGDCANIACATLKDKQ